ncbi:MAG: helix-turn-helix domain-containing protein [Armatimonadetes bacterium]|nr:helix-turn-helix domain-containing protein [Armatimonadota bacterium]
MRSGLGILLEREIERRGLTVKEFAEGAGVPERVVLRLVRAQQRSAQRPTLEKLAAATGSELWHLEMLGSPIKVDYSGLPDVETPPGVLEIERKLAKALDQAIQRDPTIPPKRKKWLKQCVEFARTAP